MQEREELEGFWKAPSDPAQSDEPGVPVSACGPEGSAQSTGFRKLMLQSFCVWDCGGKNVVK